MQKVILQLLFRKLLARQAKRKIVHANQISHPRRLLSLQTWGQNVVAVLKNTNRIAELMVYIISTLVRLANVAKL